MKNPGKQFWSALDYIIKIFRDEEGKRDFRIKMGEYGISRKSITLVKNEWEALDGQYDKLEQIILNTMEDAQTLADDLEEMKWLDEGNKEAYRAAAQKMAEEMIERLQDFVDDDKKNSEGECHE